MKLKVHLIFSVLVIVATISFTACNNSEGAENCKISTPLPGATVTGFDEEKTTPFEVENSGRKEIELEVTQKGFHSKKVIWNPKKKAGEFIIELDPVVSSVTIKTEPADAEILYNDKKYKSGDQIELIYKPVMIIDILKEGYKAGKLKIEYSEVEENYNVNLELDPVEMFAVKLRGAVARQDKQKATELCAPFTKEALVGLHTNPISDEFPQKFYKIASTAEDFYENEQWDQLKFILSIKNVPGVMNPYTPSPRSFLEKAILKDDETLLRELIEAGADVEKDFNNITPTPAIFLAIKHKSHKTLEELLKLATNPDLKNYKPPKMDNVFYTQYPIFKAIEMKDQKSIDILLQYGASTDVEEIWGEINHNDAGELITTQTTRKLVENDGKWEIVEKDGE